jgi:microcystin-dependent protein
MLRSFANLTAHERPIVGDIKYSVVATDHMGWLLCDGRTVNVADFRFLFDAIGYSFGGSNDTFLLPNPAGKVAGAIGSNVDVNMSTATFMLGDVVGEYMHTLTVPELARHSHSITDPSHAHAITDPGHAHSYSDTPNNQNVNTLTTQDAAADNFRQATATTSNFTGIIVNSNTTGITVNNQGSNVAHNNVQPTIFMGNMYIYSGRRIFPTITGQAYNGWPQFYQGDGTYSPPDPPLN